MPQPLLYMVKFGRHNSSPHYFCEIKRAITRGFASMFVVYFMCCIRNTSDHCLCVLRQVPRNYYFRTNLPHGSPPRITPIRQSQETTQFSSDATWTSDCNRECISRPRWAGFTRLQLQLCQTTSASPYYIGWHINGDEQGILKLCCGPDLYASGTWRWMTALDDGGRNLRREYVGRKCLAPWGACNDT